MTDILLQQKKRFSENDKSCRKFVIVFIYHSAYSLTSRDDESDFEGLQSLMSKSWTDSS